MAAIEHSINKCKYTQYYGKVLTLSISRSFIYISHLHLLPNCTPIWYSCFTNIYMIDIDILCKVSLPQFYMDRSNISNFSSDRNCRIKRKDEKFLFYSKIKFHMVNATSKLLPFYTRIKQYREILIYILLSSMANGA